MEIKYIERKKNVEIERLRAIAVILVTVAHGVFASLLPDSWRYSFTGVDLFFVISGFVVTLSVLNLLPELNEKDSFFDRLAHASGAFRVFYLRRAFRILLLAFGWIGVYIFLAYFFKYWSVGKSAFPEPTAILKEMVGFSSGFYNYLVSYGLSGGISHYWSLAVEEQFYLILPVFLVFFVTGKNRIKFTVLSFLFLSILPLISNTLGGVKPINLIYSQRYFGLMLGVLIAFYFYKKKILNKYSRESFFITYFTHHGKRSLEKLFSRKYFGSAGKLLSQIVYSVGFPFFYSGVKIFKPAICLLCVAVIGILPGIISDEFKYNFGYVVVVIFSGVLVLLASREEGWILNIPVINKILEYIGSRSYAIYLCHFAFIRLDNQLFNLYNIEVPVFFQLPAVRYTFIWIGMIIASEISYRIVEKPFINMGKAYIESEKTAQAVPDLAAIALEPANIKTHEL